jgi:hypothetical protein
MAGINISLDAKITAGINNAFASLNNSAQSVVTAPAPAQIIQPRAPAAFPRAVGLFGGWQRPVQPGDGDDSDAPANYSSDGAESHHSRRDRAAEHRQLRTADDQQRKGEELCKEYSKARPPSFNAESMDIWVEQFTTLLTSLPLGHQLESALLEPPQKGKYSFEQSRSVFSLLSRTFDSKIPSHLRALGSIYAASKRRPDAPAYAAYSALVAEFLPEGYVTTTALHTELHMGALQQESGTDYLHRIQSIIRRLESLGSSAGDEGFQAATIIRGLPTIYQSIKQAFYARSSAVWTINDIKCSVKETDQQQVRDTQLSGSNSSGGAFLASDRGTCYRCHQPGHLEQNCRAILPRGILRTSSPVPNNPRQQRLPRREYTIEERTAFFQRKLAEVMTEAKEQTSKKAVTFLADNTSHTADDTPDATESANSFDDEDTPVSLEDIYGDGGDEVFMALASRPLRLVTTVPPLELLRNNPEQRCGHAVIDSGASKHISAVRADFGSTLRPLKDPYHIGGVCVKAVGIGSVSWRVVDKTGQPHLIRLSNVLYAPELLERTTYHTRLISTRMAGHEHFRFDLGLHDNGMFTYNDNEKYARFFLPIVGGVPVLPVKIIPMMPTVAPPPPVVMLAEDCATLSSLWHARLGHPCDDVRQKVLTHPQVTGVTDQSLKASSGSCATCAVSKATKQHVSRVVTPRVTQPFSMNRMDIAGPLETPSMGGHRVLFGTVCGSSAWLMTEPSKHKSESPVVLEKFHARVKSLHQVLTGIRADNDTVFQSAVFRKMAHQLEVSLQFSAPYTPTQIGMMERMWRTLFNMVRALLSRASLPKEFWVLAARCATYLINRLYSSAAGDIPWCLLHPGQLLDLSHLRTFGCAAYVMIPAGDRKKLDPKASLHIFVGYSEESKAWLVWDPVSRALKTTMHCTFDEHYFPGGQVAQMVPVPRSVVASPSCVMSPAPSPPQALEAAFLDLETMFDKQPQALTASVPAVIPGRCPPKFPPPTTMRKLDGHPQEQDWRESLQSELDSLLENKTFTLVRRPLGVNVLRCKVVFKAKLDEFGNVQRFKSRLVVQGCGQRPGTDFDGEQLFAPVCAYSSLRVMLSMACQLDWDIHGYDVSTAFLNAKLPEVIYMEQPPDAWGGPPILDVSGQPLICLLYKSLYGLKQAPRLWHQLMREHLLKHGWEQLRTDRSLYMRCTDGSLTALLAVYVDDMALTAAPGYDFLAFSHQLNSSFKATYAGEVSMLLGMVVERDRAAGTLRLHQSRYLT